MSEDRNRKETVDVRAESTGLVNRRSFVKALGATGAIGLSGIGSAQAQASDEEIKREVNEVTGSDRQAYISMALSDSEVETITEELERDEWSPNTSDATVNRIDKADEDSDLNFSTYHVVHIPFEKSVASQHSSESAGIVWTDKSIEEVGFTTPAALVVEEEPEGNPSIATQDDEDGSPTALEYTVENGEIKEEKSDISSEETETESEGVTAQGCYCRVKRVKCDNVPLHCWVSLAASYAGTYWSCGACGVGAIPACGMCAVVVAGAGASSHGCLKNHDCRNVTVCRNRNQVNRKPCRVCSNINHPNC